MIQKQIVRNNFCLYLNSSLWRTSPGAKFTGKHLYQSLFFLRLWHSCVPVDYCEFFKNTFFYRISPVATSDTIQLKFNTLLIINPTEFNFHRFCKVFWYDYSKFRSSRRRCSIKKVLLEIYQNSQGSSCARASFLIKLQVLGLSVIFSWDRNGWIVSSFIKFKEIFLTVNFD